MLKTILKGIIAYGNSFKLISQLGLWKYFAIPILISVFFALIIGLSAWGLSDNIGSLLARLWVWEWGVEVFQTISTIIGGLMVITFGLIIYKHVVMALSAPFMSPVSEKIEASITGIKHTHRNTSNFSQLIRGIRINFRNLMMELLLTIPILLIGFIPLIGIISTFLLFIVQSYYAGFGNMDYTLERHFNVVESIDFVKKNRGVAIGNGIVFMLVLFVPLIGIIFVLPLSVTAASSETVQLLQSSGQIKSKQLIQKEK